MLSCVAGSTPGGMMRGREIVHRRRPAKPTRFGCCVQTLSHAPFYSVAPSYVSPRGSIPTAIIHNDDLVAEARPLPLLPPLQIAASDTNSGKKECLNHWLQRYHIHHPNTRPLMMPLPKRLVQRHRQPKLLVKCRHNNRQSFAGLVPQGRAGDLMVNWEAMSSLDKTLARFNRDLRSQTRPGLNSPHRSNSKHPTTKPPTNQTLTGSREFGFSNVEFEDCREFSSLSLRRRRATNQQNTPRAPSCR